ncbi:hypothetical protein BHQ18_21435 [Mycolicibacterium flavescens]|uniref:Uncharacterized protein n=2 Tax=Mycolicibacterium flavescens TaxID=1776 RepID=A0A1E3RDH9_MYCFV|nr:hypothetical protein BHQ18_21435 [Mycolicibacterium flavescens]
METLRALRPYERGDLEREREQRGERIRELSRQGCTVREIAAKATSYMRQRRLQRDETIRELYEQGWSMQKIADELGCSKATVSNAIHRTVLYYKNG